MGHEHGWPYEKPDTQKCTEIAPNVCLRPAVHGGDPDATDTATGEIAGGPDEHLAGFIIAHEVPGGGRRHEGFAGVDPHNTDQARWDMTGTLEGGDLTLSPSILCSDGFHGFVRNGKWEQA